MSNCMTPPCGAILGGLLRLGNVRFGSLAAAPSDNGRGRFTPESGHERSRTARPLWPQADIGSCPWMPSSSVFGRCGGDYIVGRHRAADTLEAKVTDRFDIHGVFDGHQHTWADQDLTRLCFVAKSRCDIGYSADRGIVEAAFKADGAERCKAVRNADAKTKVVAQSAPFFNQRSDRHAHIKRHLYGLQRRVRHRNGIVENHHHAVTGKPFKCAAVFDEDLADRRMVFT